MVLTEQKRSTWKNFQWEWIISAAFVPTWCFWNAHGWQYQTGRTNSTSSSNELKVFGHEELLNKLHMFVVQILVRSEGWLPVSLKLWTRECFSGFILLAYEKDSYDTCSTKPARLSGSGLIRAKLPAKTGCRCRSEQTFFIIMRQSSWRTLNQQKQVYMSVWFRGVKRMFNSSLEKSYLMKNVWLGSAE